ncbi:hypothetical protein IV73_GL000313 [Weissella kandleri]|uniref:ABC-2 type transporter transmembrane domain-containing protein n=1 Tax=Weissella kandleri TaxID=1616 RepID=A0A0R2JIV2_9LACO|nr:ABC transporter permease [Weissella kandleri]KRN75814.1 hypothetical protein IV73_GL000313 [Weissella kandleri]
MNSLIQVLIEQIKNHQIAQRIVKYDRRSSSQDYYLGQVWEIINPILQVSVYFLMIFMGLRSYSDRAGGSWGFLSWMLVGMGVYRFISQTINVGSKAVKRQLGIAAKMNFPLSIAPQISLLSNLLPLYVLVLLGVGIRMYAHLSVHINLIALAYYFAAAVLFAYGMALLLSTLVIIVPDLSPLIGTALNMGMWLSGVIFPVESMSPVLMDILQLNPTYYLVYGFRNTLFGNEAAFNINWDNMTILFWTITLIILMVGSHLHLKFKSQFSEYV